MVGYQDRWPDHSYPPALVNTVPTGSATTNRGPPSRRFSAQIRPPCACTIARQMARPRPVPGMPERTEACTRKKLIEDVVKVVWRNSWPAVFDAQLDVFTGRPCQDPHSAVGRRVPRRILQQVGNDALELRRVHDNRRELRRHFDGQGSLVEQTADAVQPASHQVANPRWCALVRIKASALDPRQLQQVTNQDREPVSFAFNLSQKVQIQSCSMFRASEPAKPGRACARAAVRRGQCVDHDRHWAGLSLG